MTPRSRSTIGMLAMLAMVPAIVGLLACMPVPIGDPERSRIDPEMTGIWVKTEMIDYMDECLFYVFEPYDKRTWLVTCLEVSADPDFEGPDEDPTSYSEVIALLRGAEEQGQEFGVEAIGFYKAWLKKLGGATYLTWEPKTYIDDGIKEPDVWFVHRVVKSGPDRMDLQLVDGESSDLFDDVEETRRAYERVIKKNVDNPELYYVENDEIVATPLARIKEEDLELFEDILRNISAWN